MAILFNILAGLILLVGLVVLSVPIIMALWLFLTKFGVPILIIGILLMWAYSSFKKPKKKAY
jgi:hypothetical protein